MEFMLTHSLGSRFVADGEMFYRAKGMDDLHSIFGKSKRENIWLMRWIIPTDTNHLQCIWLELQIIFVSSYGFATIKCAQCENRQEVQMEILLILSIALYRITASVE